MTIAARLILFCTVLASTTGIASHALAEDAGREPIPIIYDTDFGEDIDDAWALALAVRSPELDVKLVTINFGGVRYKARMVAKLLDALGRDDIPIAIGRSRKQWRPRYYAWAKDYDVKEYAGEISKDAVGKMIETIEADRTGRLKVVPVGSMLNVAEVVKRRPDLVKRVELVAMSGRIKPRGDGELSAETNVRVAVGAAKTAYGADWKRFTIAPLDVTGALHLAGERYQRVYRSKAAGIPELIEAYKVFEPNAHWANYDVTKRSSNLHDAVAVYLAWSSAYLEIEKLPLRVVGKGYTKVDEERGKPVHVALAWRDMEAFRDMLVERLTNPADAE